MITIYEVGPRDGLQNEAQNVPTEIKLALIKKLEAAGLRWIEVTSFVSAQWVPQMADHAQIMQQLERQLSVHYPVLVPNERGMQNAIAAGARDIAIFAAASESFSRKNINCSIEESFTRFAPVIALAREHNIRVRGYVSCIAGCPYEGAVKSAAVTNVAARLYDMGCAEISLGDTIGVGTPRQIQNIIRQTATAVPLEKIALHCHDTYGQALANIYAALEIGVRIFDASVAGLGGCPYAKGASGNVATEDVVYMMNGLGLETGIDLAKLVDAAWFIAGQIGRAPSRVAQAFLGAIDGQCP